jgi:hypothetical protein
MANFDAILKSVQWSQDISKSFGINSQITEMLKLQSAFTNNFDAFRTLDPLKYESAFAKSFSFLDALGKSNSWRSKLEIPQSVFDSITSINRQHDLLFSNLKSITESTIFQSPSFAQINNLNFALNGISSQIAEFAVLNKDWGILEDFEEVTEQAFEFTDSLTEKLDEEQKRQFQILLSLVQTFINKYKNHGVSALLVIDIFLRCAGIHQYFDFLKEKPQMATKLDINQIRINQDSVLHFIHSINEQLKQAKEYRITNRICEIKLKPKAKSITLTKLPKGFNVVVI